MPAGTESRAPARVLRHLAFRRRAAMELSAIGVTMKTTTASFLCLLIAVLTAGKLSSQAQAPALSHAVTQAQYERWEKDLSNWGRLGKDDESGTLNLITP